MLVGMAAYVVIAVTLGLIALFLSFPVQHAEAASMTFTSDTTITTNQTIASGETWKVDADVVLTIGDHVTVINNGDMISNGTISISSTGKIENNGDIHIITLLPEENFELIQGFENRGSLENNGNFINTSEISNFGNITNSGTINNENGLRNFGTIINAGTINNNAYFQNGADTGGSTGDNLPPYPTVSSGTIINQGTINNDLEFPNFGFIDNQGTFNDNHELISFGVIIGNAINDNNVFCRLNVDTETNPVPLGNQINATVQQLHSFGNLPITFRWLDADLNLQREVVDTSPPFEDHFSPNTPGVWTVFAACGDFIVLQTVQQPIKVTMNVIPESPVGTLALILSSIAALTVYSFSKASRKKK